MIRDVDFNGGGRAPRILTDDAPPTKEDWICRIDQVRGVIALAVQVLNEDTGYFSCLAACALDLANEEVQRLRRAIDEGLPHGEIRTDAAPSGRSEGSA